MFAVTIEPLNSMVFLAADPGEGPWTVEPGVELDLPSHYGLWPEGSPCPDHVVGRSTADPKHLKVFKYSRDLTPGEFQSTGKTFGGLYSRRAWERFRNSLSKHLAFLSIPDDDPADTLSQPTAALRDPGE